MKKGHSTPKDDKAKPMSKEDVKKNPDMHIDQDFPGYPGSPASENNINPKSAKDKVGANLIKKNNSPSAGKKKHGTNKDEQSSDGSGNAFEATENEEVLREELNDNETNY